MEELVASKFYQQKAGLTFYESMVDLLNTLNSIDKGIEKILDKTLDKDFELLYYLYTHMVFPLGDRNTRDRITKYFLLKLYPIHIEVLKRLVKPKTAPKELMEAFSIFKPVNVYDDEDGYLIRAGLWNRNDEGGMEEPIWIMDTCTWPDTVVNQAELRSVLESYKPIKCTTLRPVVEIAFDPTEELPF